MKKLYQIWNVKGDQLVALADQAVCSGGNFIIAIIIGREAGVEGFGEFALIWTTYFILLGPFDALVGTPALVVSNKELKKAEYFQQTNSLANVFLPVLFLIATTFIWMFTKMNSTKIEIDTLFTGAVAITFFLKHEIQRKLLIASGKTHFLFILDLIVFSGLTIFISCIDMTSENGIHMILLTYAVIGILSFSIFHLHLRFNIVATGWSQALLKNWNYGKFLVGTQLIQAFNGNLLSLTMAALYGNGALGIVRLSQNIMGVINVLFTVLENFVPVKASYFIHKISFHQFNTYLKKVIALSLILFTIILTGIWWLSEDILWWVYAIKDVEQSNYLKMFAALYFLIFISTFSQIYLKSVDQNKSIFIVYLINFIVALLVAYPLLINFGIMGYFYGTFCLQLVGITYYLLRIKSIHHELKNNPYYTR